MVTATATVNLRTSAITRRAQPWHLTLLLRIESWLDRRAGRNALYTMDERGLHDIGLTSADVIGADRREGWQDHLIGQTRRR
ncbi:DUF1127 domain-containing protein [Microvirga antarctica]|uniref:DUF1127 domain-containing protein n=1 Tax=Microvirga antarctica TaxID=2819233 RepID=UPI001B314BA7|nr:DUF1127 domain-containing protein [Microvirga antarctica]